MKKASVVTAVALLSLASPVAAACGHDDPSTSAAVTPPAQMASVQPPAATKVPASTALKAPAQKTAPKQVADKTKESNRDVKVAVLSSN